MNHISSVVRIFVLQRRKRAHYNQSSRQVVMGHGVASAPTGPRLSIFDGQRENGPGLAPSAQQVLGDRFGARMNLQLFVNATDVATDGVNAQTHFIGNDFVGLASGKQIQHFTLSV